MKSINELSSRLVEQTGYVAHYIERIDSTNTWSKKLPVDNDPLHVFFANHQTQGRGRGNRTWTNAPAGATLLSTWRMPVGTIPHPLTSVRIGLRLHKALTITWPHIPFALKAPNDIYIGDGKLAGLLAETVSGGNGASLHIGLGMNVLEAPNVPGQNVTALADHDTFDPILWKGFLTVLAQEWLELGAWLSTAVLSDEEQADLLSAMRGYYDNHVQAIEKDGTLVLVGNGRIPWNEL